MRKTYSFNQDQCELHARKYIETAILRAKKAHQYDFYSAAVLYLKSAYQSVVRMQLMKRVDWFTSAELAAQVRRMLSENSLPTIGDSTNTVYCCKRGVHQGSSLSLSI